jgi:hypothetical protein
LANDRSSPQGIFLSYRREDAAPYARLLQFQLSERFPDAQVFMDLDSIEAGLDFADVIGEAVDSCALFVALIGRQWATLADDAGNRRLDDPDDFVRFEVQAALERGVRVIPVLVDGAAPLRLQQLPSELHKLARLNAFELSYGRYQYDAERLIDLIQRVLAEAPRASALREIPSAPDAQGPTLPRAEGADGEAAQKGPEPVRGPVGQQRQAGQGRLIDGLEARSFKTHGSDRSWYHPSLPDFRVVLQKTSFRLEVRNTSGYGRPWQATTQIGRDGTLIQHPGGDILDYRAADEGLARIDERLRTASNA